MSIDDLAQKAYAAYVRRLNFRGPHGEPFPHWDEMSESERLAWRDAANVLLREFSLATSPG